MMFRKILVPLDGSELAERILLPIQSLASSLGSEVHLVSASESPSEWGHLIDSYLKSLTTRLTEEGLRVHSAILYGKPADELLDYAELKRVSLIAMATHGRSGISRWAVGSVTDKIVRSAGMPVLVYPSPSLRELSQPKAALRKFLVPLDGSELAASAVPTVLELAHKLGAEVLLLQVVEQDGLKPEAQDYLNNINKKFQKKEVKASIEVKSGTPAQQILECASSQAVDLIALSTHGRGGVGRWLLGSVADKVVHAAECAVLLTRAKTAAPAEAPVSTVMVRRCYHCGRRTYMEVFFPGDKCLRCGYHLRACGNCVHYNGVGCLLQRPEVHDPYPGMHCPVFQFRQTPLTVK